MSADRGRGGVPLERQATDLEAIKARLVDAGYPRPVPGQVSSGVREPSKKAAEARAVLREHIIEDLWALLDEVERLRAKSGS